MTSANNFLVFSYLQKTHAYHKLKDDVPEDIKKKRLQEVIDTFNFIALDRHRRYIGTHQLVLVDKVSVVAN